MTLESTKKLSNPEGVSCYPIGIIYLCLFFKQTLNKTRTFVRVLQNLLSSFGLRLFDHSAERTKIRG